MAMNTVYASTAEDIAQPFIDSLNSAIVYPIVSLLLGIALLVFLWGVFVYIRDSENDEARATGKRHMIFGIIGLVIMVSAVAILEIAKATFGIS